MRQSQTPLLAILTQARPARRRCAGPWPPLPKVRRLLANVATYMIFDDHEVTDDWFIEKRWCNKVLGSDRGRRIVRNALTAYAVFQHWGNDPNQFDEDQPGGKLLKEIESIGEHDPLRASRIDKLLGIPETADELAPLKKEGIRWPYRYDGPVYDAIVLDTRMRRAFPSDTELALMDKDHIDEVLKGSLQRSSPSSSLPRRCAGYRSSASSRHGSRRFLATRRSTMKPGACRRRTTTSRRSSSSGPAWSCSPGTCITVWQPQSSPPQETIVNFTSSALKNALPPKYQALFGETFKGVAVRGRRQARIRCRGGRSRGPRPGAR